MFKTYEPKLMIYNIIKNVWKKVTEAKFQEISIPLFDKIMRVYSAREASFAKSMSNKRKEFHLAK
jgi:hypothetical protein